MLFINGTKKVLTSKEKDDLKKELTFPFRIKYAKKLKKKDTHHKNRALKLVYQPSAIPIPFKARLSSDKDGHQEVIFCQRRETDKNGNHRYLPSHLDDFDGDKLIHFADYELAWFLWNKSPHCENGKAASKNTKSHYFYIEQTEKEAASRAPSRKIRLAVEILLFGDMNEEGMLPHEEIIGLAKAYSVSNAESYGTAELREELFKAIEADGRLSKRRAAEKGLQGFLNIVHSQSKIEERAVVTDAIDKGIIKFEKKSWNKITDGVVTETIFKNVPAGDHVEKLTDKVKLDPELLSKLKLWVAEAEPVEEVE